MRLDHFIKQQGVFVADKIDINSAPVTLLTQLPGVGINIAYNILNYRTRHGFFTDWSELGAVKEFPIGKLDQIRERAVLIQPAEGNSNETYPKPRHLKHHAPGEQKGTEGYTKSMRSTRRPERLHDSQDHSNHGSGGKKTA